MASKPQIAVARWADQISANLLSPSSGLRDTGFLAGTPAVSGYVNTMLGELYKWALYVNDGVWDGDIALNGSFTVGGQLVTFVDFTYTADSTTDKLARTAHGLQTGYGPVRTSNSGGALPAGVLAATDYYVIRSDADHLQLAATRSDALAGFAIDFTSNGTGTQTLLHQSSATKPTDAAVSRALTVTGGATVGSGTVGGTAFSYPSTVFIGNATFDNLAIDNHGMQTGSGPMVVSNVGGALPSPLLAATPYYVIRSNSGKIQLALSFVNAMAGVAIDLTTSGTGTNSIASGTSPTVAGSLAVHGNVTVDGVIISHQPRVEYPSFLEAGGFVAGINPVNPSFSVSYNTAGAVTNALISVPFKAGDSLINIRYQAAGNGSADLITGAIFYAPSMGVTAVQLTGWTDINRAAAWGVVDVALIGSGPVLVPTTLAAGGSLLVQLITNAAGYSVGMFEYYFG